MQDTIHILNKKHLFILLASIAFLGGVIFYGGGVFDVNATHNGGDRPHSCGDGYRVYSTQRRVECHGVCWLVNPAVQDVFVSTRVASEWSSYINKPAPGSTLTNCPSPPPPTTLPPPPPPPPPTSSDPPPPGCNICGVRTSPCCIRDNLVMRTTDGCILSTSSSCAPGAWSYPACNSDCQ